MEGGGQARGGWPRVVFCSMGADLVFFRSVQNQLEQGTRDKQRHTHPPQKVANWVPSKLISLSNHHLELAKGGFSKTLPP